MWLDLAGLAVAPSFAAHSFLSTYREGSGGGGAVANIGAGEVDGGGLGGVFGAGVDGALSGGGGSGLGVPWVSGGAGSTTAGGLAQVAAAASAAATVKAWRLQMLLRGLHLAFVAAPLALALLPGSVRGRRRNHLLLLHGFLDLMAVSAVTVPRPWGAALLPAPVAWFASLRRLNLQWLLRCVLEPCLSQVWLVLAGMPSLFAVTRESFGGWRAPAFAFVATCVLCRMGLSLATDILTRRRFLRHRRGDGDGDGGGGGGAGASGGSRTARVVGGGGVGSGHLTE
ncbi:hypothetical protein GPECTOR_58g600 [Gonium pectorale]|uniref:Uncharacterized protein n=1 Tax=Gonium pectorale TaxID=33097 RepID=A0A150G5P5_GONPE|nr:hypothetical protein GPECTOR_58g600 [Gonium pectorale]|eukprot:KXZ45151.1 hypothetical protein GPECTOR_58g600 [Gonium pectorale]